jgi:hypothetical protein
VSLGIGWRRYAHGLEIRRVRVPLDAPSLIAKKLITKLPVRDISPMLNPSKVLVFSLHLAQIGCIFSSIARKCQLNALWFLDVLASTYSVCTRKKVPKMKMEDSNVPSSLKIRMLKIRMFHLQMLDSNVFAPNVSSEIKKCSCEFTMTKASKARRPHLQSRSFSLLSLYLSSFGCSST